MIEQKIAKEVKKFIEETVNQPFEEKDIQIQKTRKDFEGDITLVVFPLVKMLKTSPEKAGEIIGKHLKEHINEIESFNIVKGFLNLTVNADYWKNRLKEISSNDTFGYASQKTGKQIIVEYSSPNTNKPLHLGHIRNCLLGYSVSEILKANGHDVKKVQIINDRGIHICKSMLAWKKWGNSETPQSSGIKGDHLVGKYYVEFDKHYKKEVEDLLRKGYSEEEAKNNAPLLLEAREMLKKWESGDKEVLELWKMMNSWVYEGFDATYKRLGVDFDKNYYESETYLEGKKYVLEGLKKGIFYQKEDGSVWCDLTDYGLDHKLLLRSDGTAVYITQDIGTAILRYKDFPNMSQMIYTVGNEQDYHFKVLFLILEKLGFEWAKECYHLSYGMVDLPTGKMKSREGTVVDADDLMQEMHDTAREKALELGKIEGLSAKEQEELFETIGMAALKYFILKVDPKKRMLFNPEESVDFNGNTGPFIQYAHARISSLLRAAQPENLNFETVHITPQEKNIIKHLLEFPNIVSEAGKEYNPALIANYTYDLVKMYNHFYQSHPILKNVDSETQNFRLLLSRETGKVIRNAMELLGIKVPERM